MFWLETGYSTALSRRGGRSVNGFSPDPIWYWILDGAQQIRGQARR